LVQYAAATSAVSPIIVATVPASLDISTASGATSVSVFREIGMLASRLEPINIPSSYTSNLARQKGINQSITLTASSSLAANKLWIDCITLIPAGEGDPFVELNNWRTGASGAMQSNMILSSSDGYVMQSISNSIEMASIFNPAYVNGSPEFFASPIGMNLTLIAAMIQGTTTTTDYQLTPRLNIKGKYRPRVVLAGH
jgi:hypothetical protein